MGVCIRHTGYMGRIGTNREESHPLYTLLHHYTPLYPLITPVYAFIHTYRSVLAERAQRLAYPVGWSLQ